MVVFLIGCKLAFPALVKNLFGMFSMIANFDLLPSEKINTFLLEYSEDDPMSVEMDNLGFGAKNFVLNAGTFLFAQYLIPPAILIQGIAMLTM